MEYGSCIFFYFVHNIIIIENQVSGGNVLILLYGGECYTPDYIGQKDILITGNKIYMVEDKIPWSDMHGVEAVDCTGKIVCPGFIDQHVHIIGGGGEDGPTSRIPEIMLSDITTSGVTTLVGVLGADGITKTPSGLLAKARELNYDGITAYIYTGNYNIPPTTITGRVISDLILINEVIGLGEIAISDHRSSHPTLQKLKEISSEIRMGGLIGGKAGVMHIHVGEGKKGIIDLFNLIDESDYPINMFVPTHLNRNKLVMEQAIKYAEKGGNIDLTAGETSESGYTVPDALQFFRDKAVNLNHITVSSDANGSIPSNGNNSNNVGKMISLFQDIRTSILDKKIDTSTVLKTVTQNVAKVLKLYPAKGTIRVGSDADILIMDKQDFIIDKVFAGGVLLVDKGKAINKGKFES